MKKYILALSSIAILAHPAYCEALLHEGAKVDLKVLDTISSTSIHEGDIIRMEVASDVLAEDGKTAVIKAGTGAKAYIGQVIKRHPAGIEGAGLVSLYVKNVKAIDGSTVPLFGTLSSTGLEKRTFSHALLLGFGAAFQSEGNTGKIKSGSILHAFVEHDTPVVDATPPNLELSGN